MSSCSSSKAIATYLDKVFPAPFVLPSDPKLLALTEQWVSLVNTLIDHTIIRTYLFAYVAPGTPDGTPNRAAIDEVMPALACRSPCSTGRWRRPAILSAIPLPWPTST